MSRSSNKSGGAHEKQVDKLRKAATKDKGRSKQKRGSAEHNTEPKHAKFQKNPGKDMEF